MDQVSLNGFHYWQATLSVILSSVATCSSDCTASKALPCKIYPILVSKTVNVLDEFDFTDRRQPIVLLYPFFSHKSVNTLMYSALNICTLLW
ncbi:hypothetical protein TNCT_664591 [Trichonephila clavata]|uniref:Secreted protein n=1 Tax=Trichonephila clavata TaxID=2740835 RepID=A0A8X6GAE9_TRICU|nr:hypothetical protein TNCT_664591 [Trichonephila clavata]